MSEIAPSIIQSEIRAMSVECDRVGGINLAQGSATRGRPALSPKAHGAIYDGFNVYTRLNGIQVLREAIAVKLQSYNHFTVDPGSEVLVTNGRDIRMKVRCIGG